MYHGWINLYVHLQRGSSCSSQGSALISPAPISISQLPAQNVPGSSSLSATTCSFLLPFLFRGAPDGLTSSKEPHSSTTPRSCCRESHPKAWGAADLAQPVLSSPTLISEQGRLVSHKAHHGVGAPSCYRPRGATTPRPFLEASLPSIPWQRVESSRAACAASPSQPGTTRTRHRAPSPHPLAVPALIFRAAAKLCGRLTSLKSHGLITAILKGIKGSKLAASKVCVGGMVSCCSHCQSKH